MKRFAWLLAAPLFLRPTLSHCGIEPEIFKGSNDSMGRIIIGKGPTYSCEVDFVHAWTKKPLCIISLDGKKLAPSTKTKFIINRPYDISGQEVDYECASME